LPSTVGVGAMTSRSIEVMELMVLMRETPSAPPALAARAGPMMLVTLGVSFTSTGIRVWVLHQRATISTYSGT